MSTQPNREPSWRKYIDEQSRSVATIREKGFSVWSLMRYFRVYKGDKERVLAGYHGDLTSEELEAAMDLGDDDFGRRYVEAWSAGWRPKSLQDSAEPTKP